jgi:predicted DNA-binding protein YlxM (UPF0122 family)
MDIQKKLTLSEYNRVYGGLLTEHQQEMLSLYYDCDVSLNELSQQYGISRQAVRDALVRGEKALTEFERVLKLIERKEDFLKTIDSSIAYIGNGEGEKAVELLTALRIKEE